MDFQSNQSTFPAPSGKSYTIREQNGADEDILSNQSDVANFQNISKFLAAIITSTSYKDGKLTLAEVEEIPALDRVTILIESRILSLGQTLDFNYGFRGTKEQVQCSIDLRDFLYDYSNTNPTDQELDEKPDAVPYYPLGEQAVDITTTLKSGKEIKFDLLTGEGEKVIATAPLDKTSRSISMIARNLHLNVDGKWEKVKSFHLFNPRDMAELREFMESVDPTFMGKITITSPSGLIEQTSIFALNNFFYLGEV